MGLLKVLKATGRAANKFRKLVGNRFIIKLALKVANRISVMTPNQIDDQAVKLLDEVSQAFTLEGKKVLCEQLTANKVDIPHVTVDLDQDGNFVVVNKSV